MREDDPGGEPIVSISDRQPLPIDDHELRELGRLTLLGEGIGDGELSISFVDDREMEELHARYLDEAGATDVLAFPIDEVGPDGARLLGDVVIAPAVAARNNPEDTPAELRLLLVHGILHLLGYDHDDERSKRAMWTRQERYSGVAAP